MLSLNYDEKYDVLYLGVSDNSNSYGAEQIDNINVFRNVDSDCVTGFLMFGFMKKYKDNTLQPLPFGFSIDYAKDVIPLIFTKN